MTSGEWLSLAINLGVGLYLAWFYPRHVRRQFAGRRLPPFFALLATVLQPLGWLLIGGSLAYLLYRLFLSP